jgi:ribonucleoside-triphosphate reductase (formate)
MSKIKEVQKRDGTVVPFDKKKIVNAIGKAMKAVGQYDLAKARKVTDAVLKEVQKHDEIPTC